MKTRSYLEQACLQHCQQKVWLEHITISLCKTWFSKDGVGLDVDLPLHTMEKFQNCHLLKLPVPEVFSWCVGEPGWVLPEPQPCSWLCPAWRDTTSRPRVPGIQWDSAPITCSQSVSESRYTHCSPSPQESQSSLSQLHSKADSRREF